MIKKILFSGAALFVGIVVAFGLTESVLKLQGFEFTLYPSKIQFGWPDPVTLQELYVVDQDLLWVPKNYRKTLADWQEARPSIVFMGDSCTEFGIYPTETGRYEQVFSELLKERAPDLDARLLNLAVSGWSSYQGLKQLERDIVPLNPTIITIYYGWNDHWTSFGIPDNAIGQYNLKMPAMFFRLNRFRVVQMFNFLYFKYVFHNFDAHRPNRVALDDFRNNLVTLVTTSRTHNIIPILLTAPSAHEKGKEPDYLAARWLKDLSQLVPLHQEYVRVVRDVAHTYNVALIDLAQTFDDPLYRDKKDLYFMPDGIHFTLEGHKKVAEFLYMYFQEHHLLTELQHESNS